MHLTPQLIDLQNTITHKFKHKLTEIKGKGDTGERNKGENNKGERNKGTGLTP